MLCSVLAALGLFACDAIGLRELKPGVSTGYDVRDKMGKPTMQWTNGDGSQTWEYARAPEGKVNYMITIGPDNILREIRQVLTEENFAKVTNGMTRDQIRRLLGKPGWVTQLDLKQQEVWEWRFDNPHQADLRFDVHFDGSGQVVETSRREEQRH
jgi:outer membrane protein assembly factor BamE (lipoprotein component of BamABCDE complex)